ncbi:MAG TPA: inorganic phosphate transporter [Thermoanaerobaculia bacterium]|nr:inorganic phosphate transporter [Thermoanaerobaculia bacterium]
MMLATPAAVAVAVLALAFANGANDNAKGVATLIGAGRLGCRRAIVYATGATLLGSALALVLAQGLLARFSGKGILAPELTETPQLALSVGAAAAATVLLATRLGLPVSTTHALVGALAGVGLASGSLHGGALVAWFLGPLLLSPPLALGVTASAYPALRRLRLALGVHHETCVCVVADPVPVDAGGAAAARSSGLRVVRSEARRCSGYSGTVAGISAQRALDGCHLLTAGAVSLARGVNDTPKIAALLVVAAPLSDTTTAPSLLLVGAAIAAGGLLAARRVATTMSHRITAMNDGQAFTANLATALMVLVASRFGVPVSTTHVSVGALFGIGAVSGTARWRTIGAILLSWVAVLPMAAGIAAGTWWLLER